MGWSQPLVRLEVSRRFTPQPQLDIVQACVSESKMMVEQNVRQVGDVTAGQSMARVWQADHPDNAAPDSVEEIKTHYNKKCNETLATYSNACAVATCTRGALEANLDATVATLKPGTRWENTTPDGTAILAPPNRVTPAGRLWQYGDASGGKNMLPGRSVPATSPSHSRPTQRTPHRSRQPAQPSRKCRSTSRPTRSG